MKKQKLSKILRALTPDETSVDFQNFDAEINKLKLQLKEKIQIKTLDDVNNQLERFRNRISFQPLIDAIEKISNSIDDKFENLNTELEDRSAEMESLTLRNDSDSKERTKELKAEIKDLNSQLSSLEEVRKLDIKKMQESIPNLTDLEGRIGEMVIELSSRIDVLEEFKPEEAKSWQNEIDAVRRELMNRIGNIGGGNMNRQITVGNVDPLKTFTDINFKAGSNVTITAANNSATKRVDITISSSGGGGGSTRSIQSISASQTADSTVGTDYVYLCSGTMTLTMPTAVSNTNLYTIKNVGVGIVTINCTGAEKIDNDTNVIMPVRYTAVDLISDTTNWNVT